MGVSLKKKNIVPEHHLGRNFLSPYLFFIFKVDGMQNSICFIILCHFRTSDHLTPTSWDSMGVLGLSSRMSRDTMQAKQDMLFNSNWDEVNIKQKKNPVTITRKSSFMKDSDIFSSRIVGEREEILSNSFYRKQSITTHAM